MQTVATQGFFNKFLKNYLYKKNALTNRKGSFKHVIFLTLHVLLLLLAQIE